MITTVSLAACGSSRGSSKATPPAVAVVIVGSTTSDTAERQVAIDHLRELVLPALMGQRAMVVVGVLNDRTDTSPIVLARVDFSSIGARAEGNPFVFERDSRDAAQRVLREVTAGLDATRPSNASAVFGAIRWAGSIFSQYDESTRKVGVILADAVDTTAGCQLAARELTDQYLPEILAACTRGAASSIADSEWVMGGAGLDFDQVLSEQTALGMQRLYELFFVEASAELIAYAPYLVASDLALRS
jgi:hypothetical protein